MRTEVEILEKRFTADEYHRMAEAGIFQRGERVELIDGKIIRMSAIGHRHWVCVNRATTFFAESFGRRAVVSIQNSLRLSDWTEPEPDVVVFKPRADFYAAKGPTPDDVFLVVEVADSSLAYDTRIKLPLFAAAGIPEFWIEDLQNELLHVYRDPVGKTFKDTRTLRAGESISPSAFPEITFRVEDLLGPADSLQ